MSAPTKTKPLTASELNLIRQWFNAVKDLNPAYLTPADYALAKKIGAK